MDTVYPTNCPHCGAPFDRDERLDRCLVCEAPVVVDPAPEPVTA